MGVLSDDTALSWRDSHKKPNHSAKKRNEWAAFTYEDGEYLITREPRGWVTFRSVRLDWTMLHRGGRGGNTDDALLKTWLTFVNKMNARDGHCWPVDIGCDLGAWDSYSRLPDLLLARGERGGIARHCSSHFFIASFKEYARSPRNNWVTLLTCVFEKIVLILCQFYILLMSRKMKRALTISKIKIWMCMTSSWLLFLESSCRK